jgi:hypothetical protein
MSLSFANKVLPQVRNSAGDIRRPVVTARLSWLPSGEKTWQNDECQLGH